MTTEQRQERAAGPEASDSRGYMARSLAADSARRLNEVATNIRARMRARRDCPQWLLSDMDDMVRLSNCLIRPLTEYRDALRVDPGDVRGYVDTMLGD